MSQNDIVSQRRGTTIRFPEDVRKGIKIEAIRRGTVMNTLVVEVMRHFLRGSKIPNA